MNEPRALPTSGSGPPPPGAESPPTHRRRIRYAGKNPRRFEEKYKERQPEQFPETHAKVLASGKTPAGMHRPIMVEEVLTILHPQPGELAVDCTLGYGGHAEALLRALQPGGRLIGLDVDSTELPKTEARLRAAGFSEESFIAHRSNYAGLARILGAERLAGADLILADLGLSSMQIDDPARGFSVKRDGPLDMRMNPERGISAAAWLSKISEAALARELRENADEPRAEAVAGALAGRRFETTSTLREAIARVVQERPPEERELTVRRCFQAIRIAVNDEFSALETFLRFLPGCLAPGGHVAILTFHSGEDRRVKKAFAESLARGDYAEIAQEVIRPGAQERQQNPRSTSAKLRWARRA